ncbi:Sigma2 domain of RNA polymerase sigma factor [Fragilariopsis cylindrus CCMP1102]|uniref:Sigma2 domain of RNA polymerase sigma factor n=1 Tax=Fragilariopsis cylindrus CCMP1102 TaxID=635003 RepID=A0A1E7FEV0_9STRA|nr:Sigma2 domain of RNA polymerase sigma factor [Fragilariopsis cylindrus CCMP1102]|eukprot:OEU16699.1 Sigma2 domain of RNA polymerase sigma factor [Fragilariopsis cylindrus CCMP1102]
MSSIPEQLPQPAVNAFRHRQQQQQQLLKEKKKKAKIINNKGDRRETHGIEFAPSSKRVNPEEEIKLAQMIQRGVWLHKLKADMETEKGSSISKNEWATIANLDSTTQLRREVATYRRAKQLLVSANMGLVNAVVKKQYYNVQKRDALSYEELIQEGSLGLIRAAELFDPSRGIRFSTYATIWIKGSLSHSHILDGSITLPAREKTKWNKIVKAHQDIIKEKGGVSVQDIANRLDMNVEEVMTIQSKMNSAKKVLSLDYEYQAQTRGGGGSKGGSGGQQLLMDMDKCFQADSDLAERTQLQADIIAAMVRNLSPREARLIRLRYGLTTDGRTHTVQECADAMGVSQTRASQLAAKCLKKLREAAEADSLEEYLLTIA